MGKIRIKTLGNEKKEKEDKKKAQQRAETKKQAEEKPVVAAKPTKAKQGVDLPPAEKTETVEKAEEIKTEKSETPEETAKPKSSPKKTKPSKKSSHSESFSKVAQLVDKNKKYSLIEALEILPKLKRAKFDETVELHINTLENNVSGLLTLPHGTGKQLRIEIANHTEDPKHVQELVKKVEAGKIDFDVLIATPDSMPQLARIARFLGPRGLMPNPKSGTVSQKPNEVAKKFEGGQMNFKTEAKFPILHLSVGKISFGDKKLKDNIQAAITAVQTKNIKNITLKSTMSPGIKLEFTASA